MANIRSVTLDLKRKNPYLTYDFGLHKVQFLNITGVGLLVNRTLYDSFCGLSDSAKFDRARLENDPSENVTLYEVDGNLFEPIDFSILCYRLSILPLLFGLFLLAVQSDIAYATKYRQDPAKSKDFVHSTAALKLYTHQFAVEGLLT